VCPEIVWLGKSILNSTFWCDTMKPRTGSGAAGPGRDSGSIVFVITPGIAYVIYSNASLCAASIPQPHGNEDTTRTTNIKCSILEEMDRIRM
jgi:hypothetical protein